MFKRKAVWHHGPKGEETSAIWKAYDAKELGKLRDPSKGLPYIYVTNTHRAMAVSKTLKGAIHKYHSFIKGTA